MQKVIVTVSKGVAYGHTIPKGIELEIRDYDIDMADVEDNDPETSGWVFEKDEDGDYYQKITILHDGYA